MRNGRVGRQTTSRNNKQREQTMGRYLLLFLLGVPLPILVLIWLFGGLH